jgi:hypothetical protein
VRVLQPSDGISPLPNGATVDLAHTAVAPMAPVPEPFPLVVVHWLDAWYDPGEQTSDDWRDEYQIRTVGYLVRDDSAVISIAQEVLPDDEGYRAVTHIPRGMVLRVNRLAPEPPTAAFPTGA